MLDNGPNSDAGFADQLTFAFLRKRPTFTLRRNEAKGQEAVLAVQQIAAWNVPSCITAKLPRR
jgi:hypothetical protein